MGQPDTTRRSVLFGFLTVTLPSLVFVPLVVFFGLYMFGPSWWPYYVTGGLALGWQWYSVAMPRWTESLVNKGVQQGQAQEIARHIEWPGAYIVGLFALHTTAAAICAINLAPWLTSRWFNWILPLMGTPTQGFARGYYLQHLELANIIVALVVAYIVCRRFQRLGVWAWALPTMIISFKLVTFTDPHVSLLAGSNPWARFSYYFGIGRVTPSLFDLRSFYAVRALEQITVVAAFYSGIAYSIGAVAQRYEVVERIIKGLRRNQEPESFSPDEAESEVIINANEQPGLESK